MQSVRSTEGRIFIPVPSTAIRERHLIVGHCSITLRNAVQLQLVVFRILRTGAPWQRCRPPLGSKNAHRRFFRRRNAVFGKSCPPPARKPDVERLMIKAGSVPSFLHFLIKRRSVDAEQRGRPSGTGNASAGHLQNIPYIPALHLLKRGDGIRQ